MYAYFTYAVTSSTVVDDVTQLVIHRIFNTNLLYSGSFYTFWAINLDFWRVCKRFYWYIIVLYFWIYAILKHYRFTGKCSNYYGTSDDRFIANCLPSRAVKDVENWSVFREVSTRVSCLVSLTDRSSSSHFIKYFASQFSNVFESIIFKCWWLVVKKPKSHFFTTRRMCVCVWGGGKTHVVPSN